MDVKGIPLQVQEFDWDEYTTLRVHKQQQYFHELDGKKYASRLTAIYSMLRLSRRKLVAMDGDSAGGLCTSNFRQGRLCRSW